MMSPSTHAPTWTGFARVANNFSSAVGPYATIYAIWRSGALEGAKTEVPIWIL
jgi:phosphate/sulfate permease